MIKQILASSLLLFALAAPARTLYLRQDPVLQPDKVLPLSMQTKDANGKTIGVVIVNSDIEGLSFEGSDISGTVDYDAESRQYSIPMRSGGQQFTVSIPGGEVADLKVYIPGGVKSEKIYLAEIYEDDDDAIAFRQQNFTIPVYTDAGAAILLDGVEVKSVAAAVNNIEITPGEHTIVARKVYPVGKGLGSGSSYGQMETIYSEEVKFNVSPNGPGGREIKIPITGAIKFLAHDKHLGDNITSEIEVAKGGEYTITPSLSTFGGECVMTELRGEYKVTYRAPGYKTKKSTYMVNPGDVLQAEIKLDPVKTTYYFAYQCSPSALFGLEFGGCGKYFGWTVKGYFFGLNDPALSKDQDYDYVDIYGESKDMSWGAQTGPIFRVLRAKTSLFLSIAAGYEQMYFDKDYPSRHLSSWVGSATLNVRFPKGFWLGVGYNVPFKSYDGESKPEAWTRAFISLGGTF